MSEVKSVSDVVLEIAASKEYENSAVAQYFNKKIKKNERGIMDN